MDEARGSDFSDFDPSTNWDIDVGPNRVVYGAGSLGRLGALCEQLGGHHVLLVTDSGIEESGHADRARASLHASGLKVETFADVDENPSTRHVEAGAHSARDHGADFIIGLGGGSAMDVAKGVNFLLTNGGRLEDYWGKDLATEPMLPSIGIPTTAGTGSEAQSFALITHEETHRKMAIGDRKARFRVVLLDPELLATLPRRVAAVAGMDAVAHAVESYVTRTRNPPSQMFASTAFQLLNASFEGAVDRPSLEHRGRMLVGAYLAGCAIEASMLGAAHAAANPLTTHCDILHGMAVSLMLPHVVRYNAVAVDSLYAELLADDGGGDAAARLASRLGHLQAVGRLPSRLRDCNVARSNLAELAKDAAEQWTAGHNPRPVDEAAFLGLYEAAY